ncbi:hypothetical protein H4R35_005466 [Dimargaris xerosporica]|nr:hypothetical protein H4R35_005466 [Dimargaris xerosporica]
MELCYPHVLAEALAYASTWYDDWGNVLDAPASNSTADSFQHSLEIFTALQRDPELATDFMADVNFHYRLWNMAQSLENIKTKVLVNTWKIGDTERARLDSIRQLMRTMTLEFAGRHEDTPFNFFTRTWSPPFAHTMQAFTLLDSEVHDTYTNVATMVLDRMHKKRDRADPHQE